MKVKTWEQDGLWYWHILDEQGREISRANNGFDDREDCRAEMCDALSDWVQTFIFKGEPE